MPFAKYKDVLFNKTPADMEGILEAIRRARPEYIIELGTQYGGATLAMADVLEEVGGKKVITVDIKDQRKTEVKNDPRILFILGSSIDGRTLEKIKKEIGEGKVLVDIDSDHRTEHVAQELELYAPLVSVGSYMIVEDTFLYWNKYYSDKGWKEKGPYKALMSFLPKHPEFTLDRSLEFPGIINNICGFCLKLERGKENDKETREISPATTEEES